MRRDLPVCGRRRPRLPSLADYDMVGSLDPDNYHQGTNSRLWPANQGTGRGTGEGLRVIHCGGCWCGEPFGHSWPGEEDGAPHPR